MKEAHWAVDGVCLTMQTDACFALLGHNGAGKTTLINVATAQLRPTEGDVLVCGASVNYDAATVRKSYGCCPQHDILYAELSAHEHLTLFGMLKGRRPSVLNRLVPDMLKQLALSKVIHKPACRTPIQPGASATSAALPLLTSVARVVAQAGKYSGGMSISMRTRTLVSSSLR